MEIGGKKNRRAKRSELKSGEGRVTPFPLSQSLAWLASHADFFLLPKLVYLSFFKAFIHFLFLRIFSLQEFNKTLTADLITSSEEFLV